MPEQAHFYRLLLPDARLRVECGKEVGVSGSPAGMEK